MKRYDSLNGIRAISCIGILLMHVLSNSEYELHPVATIIIEKFTNFVFLFMVLSAFSMCCGYFDKIKNNKISMEDFYKKRIKKILPFFSLLVVLDIIIEHSFASLVEGFADVTMLFGFLPNEITVIGVGWFIGLVFIFYLMFPFFVYLFSNKKRAWITTLIALLMNISCIAYFNVGRTNMFNSFLFFCIGGLIFIYKENLIELFKTNRFFALMMVLASTGLFFLPFDNEYLSVGQIIIYSVTFVIYAIAFDKSILNNKIDSFIGSISLEIYLSHMIVFRILEKANILKFISNPNLAYVANCVIVLLGAILIAKCYKFFESAISKKVLKNENIVSK